MHEISKWRHQMGQNTEGGSLHFFIKIIIKGGFYNLKIMSIE